MRNFTKGSQRTVAMALVVALAILPIGCGGNKTAQHKLAIYTANADAGFEGLVKVVAKLQDAGKISNARAKSLYLIANKAVGANSVLRGRAEAGFDQRHALIIINDLITDLNKLEEEAVIDLDPNGQKRFKEITFFVSFTLKSIQAVIEATKEPILPESEIQAAMARPRALAVDETVWTDLVLILQEAILKSISQTRLDQAGAFAAGKTLNEATRALIANRLAGLETMK